MCIASQFSGYYGSIFADKDDLKRKIFSKFLDYCKNFNFFTQILKLIDKWVPIFSDILFIK